MRILKWVDISIGFFVSTCCCAIALLLLVTAQNGLGVVMAVFFGISAFTTGATTYNRIFHPEVFRGN